MTGQHELIVVALLVSWFGGTDPDAAIMDAEPPIITNIDFSEFAFRAKTSTAHALS